MLLRGLGLKAETDERAAWRLPVSTRSLCPVCVEVIDAQLYEDDGQVFMHKECAVHGVFNELISSDVDFFEKLRRTHYEHPGGIENPNTVNETTCPYECGLCEQHLSSSALVNVDLTNRCNMRCPICFANANASGTLCEISLDQLRSMLDVVQNVKPRHASCLQFAGGEPTVHPDFIEAVRLAAERGFAQVQVASNGLRFAADPAFAEAAAEAGLNVLYLQFDGVDDSIYRRMRGRPLMETKLRAVENAGRAGLRVILVPTVVKGLNDHQLGDIVQFAIDHIDVVTAVNWQPVAITGRIDESKRLDMRFTTADLARCLEEQCDYFDMRRDWYPFSVVMPFTRLMEAVTGVPQLRCSCHPHCGCATYLAVDTETGEVAPFPAFIDIEPALAEIDRTVTRIEKHPWLKGASALQVMTRFKKHFHPERAPEGWDFDQFMRFVQEFVKFTEQHSDREAYLADLRRKRSRSLLMAAMHFQDVYNFEVDRVRRCVVHYVAPDGKLYPFCTWNSGPCHRNTIEAAYGRPWRSE